MELDAADKTMAAQTLWDFHREPVERGCTGGTRAEATRDGHGPNNLLRDVQALSQQMEAPQCQQRGGDWSVVRRHLQELIRENSELRKRLTLALQRCLLAGRCTAHQEELTQVFVKMKVVWMDTSAAVWTRPVSHTERTDELLDTLVLYLCEQRNFLDRLQR
ncbi:unnamed protein product [Pleuronectes platessa]|uniref:Uncharacterized protein n=1 Tax=Pleuronectes platessa TaxID=8262 RepID=A0A9N7VRU5_PLEPL|nr:unnamed protein product [Pleuronectes platessa]